MISHISYISRGVQIISDLPLGRLHVYKHAVSNKPLQAEISFVQHGPVSCNFCTTSKCIVAEMAPLFEQSTVKYNQGHL